MPSTSPMPPENLAAVSISDRSTETQTQTGYPSIGSGVLTPRSPVLPLGSSCCAPDARSGPSSSRPAVLDEPRRVASPDHSADCRFVPQSALATRLLLSTRIGSDDGCERCPCRRESRAARTGQRSTCCSPDAGRRTGGWHWPRTHATPTPSAAGAHEWVARRRSSAVRVVAGAIPLRARRTRARSPSHEKVSREPSGWCRLAFSGNCVGTSPPCPRTDPSPPVSARPAGSPVPRRFATRGRCAARAPSPPPI